jgi:protein SCO1/2
VKAAESSTYKLTGVVRAVDPARPSVTIRHDEIPGFMAAMTMTFRLKDASALEDVRPGDEVEATLVVVKQGGEVSDYELNDLVVSRPAPAPAVTIHAGESGPEVSPAAAPLKPGDEVPDFEMTTQDGQKQRLIDLRGHVVALTFIYTRCPLPDFCPRMDRKFSVLADRVSAVPGREEQVRLISLSFDPEHDTPEVLRRHAALLGGRPPLWTFAVASHEELARIARPLGLLYGPGKGEIIHNLTVALIDPEGRLIRSVSGPDAGGWEPADLLKSLYSRIPTSKGN